MSALPHRGSFAVFRCGGGTWSRPFHAVPASEAEVLVFRAVAMLLRPAEARHCPHDALEILWLSEADGAPRMAAELVKLCWCLLV